MFDHDAGMAARAGAGLVEGEENRGRGSAGDPVLKVKLIARGWLVRAGQPGRERVQRWMAQWLAGGQDGSALPDVPVIGMAYATS